MLVDDAEDLRDSGAEEALLTLLAERGHDGHVALVASTTLEQAAIGYRGLVAAARRDRCLIVLNPGPGEAALLNTRLPRQPVAPPPGRALVIGSRHWGPEFAAGPLAVQVALPQAGPAMWG